MNDLLHTIEKLSNNFNIDEKRDFDKSVKSAVFFLFLKTDDDFSILLLKRSSNLSNHAGEICFPGGTYKSEDVNLIETAFRETFEETGISRESIKWISGLNHEDTRTGFRIYPYLGVVEKKLMINIDNSEIVNYIILPVKQLLEMFDFKKLWFVDNNNTLYSKPLFFLKKR